MYAVCTEGLFSHSSCRILGSGTCFGISAYALYLYRRTPITKLGDRRFDAALCLFFAALGAYRAFLY